MTKILSVLKVVIIHQHVKFQAIPLMPSQENAQKPQTSPILLSQKTAKIMKTNRPWPKSNQFWRWSGYINMPNYRPFLLCVLQIMFGNPKFDLFHFVKMPPKWEKSPGRDHNLNLISSGGGQDTSTCQISGPSSHAFSSYARKPKVPGNP